MIFSSIMSRRIVGLVAIATLLVSSTIWSADYTMDANTAGTYDWDGAAPTDWTPNTGYPDGTGDNATVNFSGSGTTNVDLGGGTYTVDTLDISTAGSTTGYFQNGTLNASTFQYTSGSRSVYGRSDFTVDGGSNQIYFNITGNHTNLQGTVQGTGGLKYKGSRYLRIYNYDMTGPVEMAAGSSSYYLYLYGDSANPATFSSLTIADNDPRVLLRRRANNGSGKYTLTVAGPTTVNDGVYRARFDSDGNTQIDLDGQVDFLRDANCELRHDGYNGTLNVNAGLTQLGTRELTLWAGNNLIDANNVNWSRAGRTRIDGASSGTVTLDNPMELGTGDFVVRSGGRLLIRYDTAGTAPGAGLQYVPNTWGGWEQGGGLVSFGVAQTAWPTLTVPKYHAVGGYVGSDITSGSPSITLAEDAVLFDSGTDVIKNNDGSNTTLTRANLGISAPTYWKAVTSNSGTYSVGYGVSADDPDDIYKGMAFTAGRKGRYYGKLNALAGQRLQFVASSDLQFYSSSGGAIAELNAYDAGNEVDIFGTGLVHFYQRYNRSPVDGNWQVINRYGHSGSENYSLMYLDKYTTSDTPAALPAGKTVNVWNGRVYAYDHNAIEGTINVNEGGTLCVYGRFTTGTYNINKGGALYINGYDRLSSSGPTLNINDPDTLLVMDYDMTGDNRGDNLLKAMTSMNVVLNDNAADNFSWRPGTSGSNRGIVLGDGHYLMGPGHETVDISSGVGVEADTGATQVGLAAFSGYTLDINRPVSLAGVDLLIGSSTPLTTTWDVNNVQRYTGAPTGTVRLDGNATVDDVTVESGTLYIGDSTADVFKATGNMTVNGSFVRLNSIAPAAAKLVDGNVTINDGGTFYCANVMNVTDALLDGLIASDIIVNDFGQLRMEVNYAANGGVGPFVVTQKITVTGDAANSPDDAQLWHDVQGSHSGPREVHYTDVNLAGGAVMGIRESDGGSRAALTLAGNATITEDGSANDFDLTGVASSGGQYTLTLGQTVTFDSTLRGTVDADTTLDLANASITLGAGGQIDGSLIARAGSTFTVSSGTTIIGGDLSVLDGSTVNFSSADVTVAGLMSGDGVISGPVTVSGSVGPGLSPGTLTTGSLTLLDASHLLYELDAPGMGGGNDLISVQGDLDVDDGTVIVDLTGLTNFAHGTYTLITYTGSIFGDASNFVIDTFPAGFSLELIVNDSGGSGGTVQLTSTPEPSALLLLLLGLGLLGYARRGRRR